MVDTIGAVVDGEGRKRAVWSALLHVIGATLAAGLLGAGLGAIGSVLGAPWGIASIVVVIVLAGAYLLRETLHLPIPVPQSRRQVPDWWRSFYTAPVAALMFGAGLGVGFLTFLTYGTFLVVAAAALVSGDPLLGVALCAPFGLARSLAVAPAARNSGYFRSMLHRLEGLADTSLARIANAFALGAVLVGGCLTLV
jgi:cytochrome c biogenesis protein CcdA